MYHIKNVHAADKTALMKECIVCAKVTMNRAFPLLNS